MENHDETLEFLKIQEQQIRMEQQVIRNQMLNRGLAFYLPQLSILKYLPGKKDENGRRVRELTLYKPYLKTMDYLAELKLQIKINLIEMDQNPIHYKNKIIKDNAYLMAKIIAVSLLNRRWKIKLFAPLLAGYIAARITSEKLSHICDLLDEMEDAGNFINSTILMSGTGRTTAPKLEKIEENPNQKPAAKQ